MPDTTDTKTMDDKSTSTAGDGATTDTGGTTDAGAAGDGTSSTSGDTDGELGDAGKRAVKAERDARKTAEDAAKAADNRARAAEAKAAKLERDQLGDNERAIAEATDKARNDTLAEVNLRLVKAEARALAAGKLADPADAEHMLDLDTFIPADGGEIDGAAIGAALDKLLEDKPYLAATTGTTETTKTGTVAGGARGDTPVTFSRSQLRDPAFYEANKEAILKAASEGRITND